MTRPGALGAQASGLAALAVVVGVAAGEVFAAAPIPLLAAALLAILLTWRTADRWLRLLALAAVAIYAAGNVHVRVRGTTSERQAADLVDERLQGLERRKTRLVESLQVCAAAAAALPESLPALNGGREDRDRLFGALQGLARPDPGIAVAIRDTALEVVGWSGRITELQGFVGLIPGERDVFALEGTLSTTWLGSAPIRDSAGAVRGTAFAELVVAARRHLRNEFLSDFDVLGAEDPDVEVNAIDLRDPGEQAHPFAPLRRPGSARIAILRSSGGRPLAAVRVSAASGERASRELMARYRFALSCLACAAALTWLWSRRRSYVGLALGLTLLRFCSVALVPPLSERWSAVSPDAYASPLLGAILSRVLRSAHLTLAASWPDAVLGPLLRSPLDLLLTSAWTLGLVGLGLVWALRRPTAATGWGRAVLGSLLALPCLALTFGWIADTLNNSPLDLESMGLLPSSAAQLFVELSLLQILACGGALLAATLALTCPWPESRTRRSGLVTLWLAVGVLAWRFWPRDILGLPLVSAIGLFLLAAAVGSGRSAWLPSLKRRSLGVRASLALALVAVLAALSYPGVVHYSEKNVRLQIEHEHAPLVRRQPEWRDYVLSAACREIDAMDLLRGAPPGAHPPGVEELAYAAWASTDLASAGLSSAVELQDASGNIFSRFAFNLPSLEGAVKPLPAGDGWSQAWETLRLGSVDRSVLHAARRVVGDGSAGGAIHLYVADDYAGLPFLAGKDPYSTLYRSTSRGSYRDRPVDLLVYAPDRHVLFSSADRPPALSAELASRASGPQGVWTTLRVDGRQQHAFLFRDGERYYGLCYARLGTTRFCANLVEAVAAPTLLALLAVIGLVALRTLLRRSSLTFPSLYQAVERRFALRVFAAFVVLAVLPTGVLQVIVGKFVRDRFWKESDDQALDLAAIARKAVEDFAFVQRGDSPGERPVTDAALVLVASLIRNDLDVFGGDRILASSKRELYASGLLPPRVSGVVYRALLLQGQPAFLGSDTIGGFSYRVVSVPVSLGRRDGILSIPLALRQREAEAAIESLDRSINLASVLFLGLAAVLAHSMSRRISGPIQALTRATRRVAQGDLDARVATRSRDELQDLVDAFNQMAGDLDRQRRDLEKSNRLAAWAEMARQVAHEIKNPLTPIQLSAEHLRRVFRDPSADFAAALEACTATILRQVRSLRDIATEFSAFARPPASEPERVDLNALAREVVRPYVGVLPAGVSLEVATEDPPAEVLGDRRLIERALVNLIENALQAVGDNGRVDVRLERREAPPRVEISVQDSGAGVSAEILARAFEPFFSTKTGGSGLGLALVKKIAEDHGGGAALSQPPLGGTRALLWFPTPPEDD